MPGQSMLVCLALSVSVRADEGLRKPVGASLPISFCEFSVTDGVMHVEWPAPAVGDNFELQVSTISAPNQHFAVVTTAKTFITLGSELLLPNTVYWLRVRFHRPYMTGQPPYLTNGDWSPAGPPLKCRTGAMPTITPLRSETTRTFPLQVLRGSEYTTEVDYLANHNSGDLAAGVAYLTEVAAHRNDPDFHKQNYWFPQSFNDTAWTLYCVDVLEVHLSGTASSQGKDLFADYMGCNGDGRNHCVCPHTDDRDRTMKCDKSGGCKPNAWTERCFLNGVAPVPCSNRTDASCKCICSPAQWVFSQAFTGMEPIFATGGGDVGGGTEQLGVWYSHPEAAECPEGIVPGGLLPDGRQCSWRRRPVARVIRGGELLDRGLQPDVKNAKLNQHVFMQAISNSPLRSWTCDNLAAVMIV